MRYQNRLPEPKGKTRQLHLALSGCKVECIAVLLPSDTPFDLAEFEKSERR